MPAAVAAFGRIDILVNTAGMSAHARFENTPELRWTKALLLIDNWGSVWCTPRSRT